MHHIGFNSGEFARAGNALALSECNVKYARPLRSRDKFNSRAWVTRVSATSFHLYQELVKVEEDETACKEEVRDHAANIIILYQAPPVCISSWQDHRPSFME